MTSNLGVNSLGYATPVFALFWLFLLSRVDVVNPDYLVVGAVAVIAANLLINFQAEIRLGFRTLIVAIWACGTFVHFRSDPAEYLDIRGWLWSSGEYFTLLAPAATVFTLILSFRIGRITTRMADETSRGSRSLVVSTCWPAGERSQTTCGTTCCASTPAPPLPI